MGSFAEEKLSESRTEGGYRATAPSLTVPNTEALTFLCRFTTVNRHKNDLTERDIYPAWPDPFSCSSCCEALPLSHYKSLQIYSLSMTKLDQKTAIMDNIELINVKAGMSICGLEVWPPRKRQVGTICRRSCVDSWFPSHTRALAYTSIRECTLRTRAS